MSIADKIVKIAKGYVGQHEIKNNGGFISPDFDAKMRSIGFQTGHAWCSYFAELVWRDAYAGYSDIQSIIAKNCSASSYKTLMNFTKLGMATKEPKVGAIVIWRKKKNNAYTLLGHVGIVTEVHEDYFVSVEGNTNVAGSREGEVVAEKKRSYSWNKSTGLELSAFIAPIEIVIAPMEVPFKTKQEGDKFRAWVNNMHPEVAKEIDLDRTGSYNNSYIKKAYSRLHLEYKKVQNG